jgi:phage terminase large subunit
MRGLKLRPVRASGWFNTPLSPAERAALISGGIVPVNDKLYVLWERRAKIWLLFGGRGGGKSEGVFDRALARCLEDDYFACYYGRKVFDTVRTSCFKTLIESIKKMKLEPYFSYSEADNSSMIVRCKHNGNYFTPFGLDKSDKLKSIKDPSCIICEEFDQTDLEDFRNLLPTLRTTKAVCEFIAMFNTRNVLPDHWIMQAFFPELYEGDSVGSYDALKNVNVQKVFINYNDNYFINQEEYYEQVLKVSAAGDMKALDADAHGMWGCIPNENPWIYNYNAAKHQKEVRFIPSAPVYLSFDFNNDPFTCVAFQFSEMRGNSRHSFLHFLRTFSGVMKVEDMCQRIKAAFPQSIFFITGDRSGQNEDVGRNQTLYQLIASLLGCSDRQLDLNTHNLSHADSRLLCNTMLYHYPHMYFHPVLCKDLISDIEKATIDKEKPVASALKKDRGNYKMDLFDAWRYGLQTYFNEFCKKAYFGILK